MENETSSSARVKAGFPGAGLKIFLKEKGGKKSLVIWFTLSIWSKSNRKSGQRQSHIFLPLSKDLLTH
jgi:hypothetical protein